MKKRQRKKNMKKALKYMQAVMTIVQGETLLTQMRMLGSSMIIKAHYFKNGGVVPTNQGLTGEIVKPNVSNEFLVHKDSPIIINFNKGGKDERTDNR